MSGNETAVAFDSRTALIVVDVQNDFANPKGNLYVPEGELVVPRINALSEKARAAGASVVYTQDWHPPETPHFREYGGRWPPHCIQGSWGAELAPELEVDGPVVRKGTGGEDGYSGFSVRDERTGVEAPTSLDGILRERGIERIVVVGLALDVCVKETALDGRRLGYETLVPQAATRPVDPAGQPQAIDELRRAGVEVE